MNQAAQDDGNRFLRKRDMDEEDTNDEDAENEERGILELAEKIDDEKTLKAIEAARLQSSFENAVLHLQMYRLPLARHQAAIAVLHLSPADRKAVLEAVQKKKWVSDE
ncbi:unnamed protein product [Phytophthora lilii]|uniref:Unnamed protein product n=1 Tax=Phytophthora lilii TaxID=2077276 RepID=A0A9W6WVZ1_9STRA|nr:unnamed protein product [Phytophthora lilii]